MEIHAKQEDIYLMNKYLLYLSSFFALSIVSCESSSELAGHSDKSLMLAATIDTPATLAHCSPAPSFNNAMLKHGFSVGAAALIKKSEISDIADNIKTVKKLFRGQDIVFDKFIVLNRHHLKKINSDVSARLYCFQFTNKEDARAWFDVIDKTKSKNKRLITFSKPKKLMALSGKHVYIVEGYHISNYDVLQLIIDQLTETEVEAVFSPK